MITRTVVSKKQAAETIEAAILLGAWNLRVSIKDGWETREGTRYHGNTGREVDWTSEGSARQTLCDRSQYLTAWIDGEWVRVKPIVGQGKILAHVAG